MPAVNSSSIPRTNRQPSSTGYHTLGTPPPTAPTPSTSSRRTAQRSVIGQPTRHPRISVKLTADQYGDIFTFKLFGRNITCYFGVQGNDFVLNGKLQDINAEEIYGPLCTPVFGKDIIYDCPNAKLMEQKKFVKFGLTQQALESYVPLIEKEVQDYIKTTPAWKGASGVIDVSAVMSQITLFTAARSLQGNEVRQKLTAEFAKLYYDLDMVSPVMSISINYRTFSPSPPPPILTKPCI